MPFGLSSLISNKINRDAAKEYARLQIMLANTAHQREVKDLRKAGLNPILSTGGSGAQTPAISAPSQNFDLFGGTSKTLDSVFKGFDTAISGHTALANIDKTRADTALSSAQEQQVNSAIAGQELDNINKELRNKEQALTSKYRIDAAQYGPKIARENLNRARQQIDMDSVAQSFAKSENAMSYYKAKQRREAYGDSNPAYSVAREMIDAAYGYNGRSNQNGPSAGAGARYREYVENSKRPFSKADYETIPDWLNNALQDHKKYHR